MLTLFSRLPEDYWQNQKSSCLSCMEGQQQENFHERKRAGSRARLQQRQASLTRALTQWAQDGDSTSLRQGKARIQASTQKSTQK